MTNLNSLYIKATKAYNNKEFNSAIEILNSIIAIDPNNDEYYNTRGLAFKGINKLEDSLKDFANAIKINKDNFNAYANRGVIFSKLKEYKNSIKEYSLAINVNSSDPNVYNSRGIAYAMLNKFEDAKKDFQTTYNLDKKNINPLLNLGLVSINAKEFPEAINYYDILDNPELNQEELKRHFYFRAYALFCIHNFDKTISDLDKAMELGYKENDLYYLKGLTYACMSDFEKSEEILVSVDATTLDIFLTFGEVETSIMLDAQMHFKQTNLFKSILNKFGINSIENLNYNDYKQIHLKTIKTISLLHVNSIHDNIVAHYTKKDAAEQMLFAKSKFRLSTVITANDPEEGKVLFNFLDLKIVDEIPGRKNNNNKDYQAFIGSFTFNHDSLNQYRLYGKLNDEEATGVSIVLNPSFFNSKMTDSNHFKSVDDIDNANLVVADDPSISKKHALYRCMYIDPQTDKIISIGHREEYTFYRSKDFQINPVLCNKHLVEYKKLIQSQLLKVRSSLDALKKLITKDLNEDIIKELIIMLSFLTKHMAFKEEQECRILSIEHLNKNDSILPKKDETKDFSSMYIDYLFIGDHVRNVYFAPKTSGFQLFIDQTKRFGINVNCIKCNHPFS